MCLGECEVEVHLPRNWRHEFVGGKDFAHQSPPLLGVAGWSISIVYDHTCLINRIVSVTEIICKTWYVPARNTLLIRTIIDTFFILFVVNL